MKPAILREVMHRMLGRGLPLTAIESSLDVSRQTLWRWRSAGTAHAPLPRILTEDQQRMIADWVCVHPIVCAAIGMTPKLLLRPATDAIRKG